MSNNKNSKVAGVFLGIAGFITLLLLYFIFIIVAAFVIGLVASIFSKSDTARGLWWFLFDRHNDGWWVYFVMYILPFFLSGRVASSIVRNHPTAEKWMFYVFGGLLLLVFVPLTVYQLFTGESCIVQLVQSVVGLISIYTGRDQFFTS